MQVIGPVKGQDKVQGKEKQGQNDTLSVRFMEEKEEKYILTGDA